MPGPQDKKRKKVKVAGGPRRQALEDTPIRGKHVVGPDKAVPSGRHLGARAAIRRSKALAESQTAHERKMGNLKGFGRQNTILSRPVPTRAKRIKKPPKPTKRRDKIA